MSTLSRSPIPIRSQEIAESLRYVPLTRDEIAYRNSRRLTLPTLKLLCVRGLVEQVPFYEAVDRYTELRWGGIAPETHYRLTDNGRSYFFE